MFETLRATAARCVGGNLNHCDHSFVCKIMPVRITESSRTLLLLIGLGTTAAPTDS